MGTYTDIVIYIYIMYYWRTYVYNLLSISFKHLKLYSIINAIEYRLILRIYSL